MGMRMREGVATPIGPFIFYLFYFIYLLFFFWVTTPFEKHGFYTVHVVTI